MFDWMSYWYREAARQYYALCAKPHFWIYAFFFFGGVTLVAALYFKSQPWTALGCTMMLICLAWSIMAAADQDRIDDPWAK